MEKRPFTTVVLATYNRAEKLKRCLDSLARQDYPKERMEIIVVDDGSRDETGKVLKDAKENLKCGFQPTTIKHSGIVGALNTGLKKASGDFICFTADDCIAGETWISAIIQGFSNPNVGAVAGAVKGFPDMNHVQRYTEDAGLLSQQELLRHGVMLSGSSGYRKSMIEEVGYFDERLPACEDVDLAVRTRMAGYEIAFAPDAVIYHNHPDTLGKLWRQQHRNMGAFVRMQTKYNPGFKPGKEAARHAFRFMKKSLKTPLAIAGADMKYGLISHTAETGIHAAYAHAIIKEAITGPSLREEKHADANLPEFLKGKA